MKPLQRIRPGQRRRERKIGGRQGYLLLMTLTTVVHLDKFLEWLESG